MADFPLHTFGSSSAVAEQTPEQGTEPDQWSPRPGGVCTRFCTGGAQNIAHDHALPQPAEQRALQMQMASAPGEKPPISVQTNSQSAEPGSHKPLPVSVPATSAPCSDNSFFFQAIGAPKKADAVLPRRGAAMSSLLLIAPFA